MTVVRLPRQHSTNRLAQQVLDAMASIGEECFVLCLYHSPADDTHPRCRCYSDVYKQSESTCRDCFGTTFAGGVKSAYSTFGTLSDSPLSKEKAPEGESAPQRRRGQLPWIAELTQGDVFVRLVPGTDKREFYIIGEVTTLTLRDGAKYKNGFADRYGSAFTATMLTDKHPITSWVPEYDTDNSVHVTYDEDPYNVHPMVGERRS